jgi:hypothetical protein
MRLETRRKSRDGVKPLDYDGVTVLAVWPRKKTDLSDGGYDARVSGSVAVHGYWLVAQRRQGPKLRGGTGVDEDLLLALQQVQRDERGGVVPVVPTVREAAQLSVTGGRE